MRYSARKGTQRGASEAAYTVIFFDIANSATRLRPSVVGLIQHCHKSLMVSLEKHL